MGSLRANIQNQVVLGHIIHLLGGGFSGFGKFLGGDHIHRDRDMHLLGDLLRRRDQVFLVQGLAHRMTGRGQESVGDTATHHQLVHHIRQGFQHLQLGGYLGTPDNRHQRLLGRVQGLAESIQLIGQQRTGTGDRGKLAHTMGGRLGPVCGAKGIHHIDITEGRHLL